MIYGLLGSVSSFESYWWAGEGAPHHLHLLFCKSVYCLFTIYVIFTNYGDKIFFHALRYVRGSKRENRRKQICSSVSRNVTILKTQLHFPVLPFPYFRASNLGKIDANFFWEIVTSSAVLDHRM